MRVGQKCWALDLYFKTGSPGCAHRCHGTNKKPHGTSENLTALTKTLAAKKNLTTQKKGSQHKQNVHGTTAAHKGHATS